MIMYFFLQFRLTFYSETERALSELF